MEGMLMKMREETSREEGFFFVFFFVFVF